MKLQIPNRKTIKQYQNLIEQKLKTIPELYSDFYHISDILTDDTPELQNLIKQTTGLTKFKLSAGTSDSKAFRPYIDKIISDISESNYYRSYNNPPGNSVARKAIAIKENIRLNVPDYYNYKDVCLSEGTTGAISQVFEYIKNKSPQAEVIIAGPTYYLYKYLARYFKLKYKEVFEIILKDKIAKFETVSQILDTITENTRLIIIGQPNNPSNKIYTKSELTKLLNICKNKNILLMVDQLFEDLLYDASKMVNADYIALQINASDNLIVIKGFSKAKNLAGFRIGYSLSKNSKLNDGLSEISEQRNCFAGASNYTGLIALDSYIDAIKILGIKQVKRFFTINEILLPIEDEDEIQQVCKQSQLYNKKLLSYYKDYLQKSKQILRPVIQAEVEDNVAYNTMVKLKIKGKVNLLELMLNFYILTNTVIQMAPCFAYDQETWQKREDLGTWIRLSYSREDKKRYFETLIKLKDFIENYDIFSDKLIKLR
ncbi:pyridoxal phosphate-dependent aminotransferase [Candidatus Dojkabacteria bacterium]|nr:pyridoxal phosphate-dependent aminotransferase [Candidatus Dojkabacteria bacterium]